MLIHNHSLKGENPVDYVLPIYSVDGIVLTDPELNDEGEKTGNTVKRTFGLVLEKTTIAPLSTSSSYNLGIVIKFSADVSEKTDKSKEVCQISGWYGDKTLPESFTFPADYYDATTEKSLPLFLPATDSTTFAIGANQTTIECTSFSDYFLHKNSFEEICIPDGMYIEMGAFYKIDVKSLYLGYTDVEGQNNLSEFNVRSLPAQKYTTGNFTEATKTFWNKSATRFIDQVDVKCTKATIRYRKKLTRKVQVTDTDFYFDTYIQLSTYQYNTDEQKFDTNTSYSPVYFLDQNDKLVTPQTDEEKTNINAFFVNFNIDSSNNVTTQHIYVDEMVVTNSTNKDLGYAVYAAINENTSIRNITIREKLEETTATEEYPHFYTINDKLIILETNNWVSFYEGGTING